MSKSFFKHDEYNVYLDRKECEICKETDEEATMLLCDICDDGYHMNCLRQRLLTIPICDWYCKMHTHTNKKSVFNNNIKYPDNNRVGIKSFFSSIDNRNTSVQTTVTHTKKRRNLTMKKKKPKFVLPHISRHNNQSLFNAMKASNMIFDDDLSYPNDAIKKMNNGRGDEKIQIMSPENLAIFRRFKESSSKGLYLPVKLQIDSDQVITV
jgi:hypothetical protein